MKITYTGRQVELAPAQLRKIESRFTRAGKLLDGRKECEAHVILSLQRHLHRAEITVNYHGHQFVGLGSGPDLFTAINAGIEKFEKQAVKVRSKWRDSKRKPLAEPASPEAVAAEPDVRPERRVYRVTNHQKHKPMTVEEALLEMEKDGDYLVYRDADTDRISVLVRRRDGDFDLVEG